MQKPKVIGYKTEFAPAERLSQVELLRQHKAWSDQTQTNLMSNASPNLILILNECRQIVYANDQVKKLGDISNTENYLGLRPGELLGCIHSAETEGGCGTTRFCQKCGAVKAMLIGLSGKNDVEECEILRGEDIPSLNLRVFTTPVTLNGETFTIFSLQDISQEKENARLTEEITKLAITDPLTGISNRRNYFEMANREFTRSIRYGHLMSMIMIDLDNFKSINDNFGHPAGDEVLIGCVQRISSELRDIDLFGRYGGDEFVLLLPETDLRGAISIADRISSLISATPIKCSVAEISLSISAGVSTLIPENDKQFTQMIDRADQDLYNNKRQKHHLDSH